MNYVVSLRKDEEHFCTGCLITKKHVVTAGQCIGKIFYFNNPLFENITAYIIGKVFKIEHAEHHIHFNAEKASQTATFNIGLIQVRPLINFNLLIKLL